jgi:hypothetical protein
LKYIISILLLQYFAYSQKIVLEKLKVETKLNGVLIQMSLDTTLDESRVSAWQASSGWFYITLYQTEGDTSELVPKIISDDIINFQVIKSAESLQIGLRLKNPIENYEFSTGGNDRTLLASLHYSTEYLTQLDSIKDNERIKTEKGIRSGIRKWLYVLGTGLTFIGIQEDQEKLFSNLSVVGVSILAFTFIIDQISSYH